MKNIQSLIEIKELQIEITFIFSNKIRKKLVFISRAIKGTEKYSCRNYKLASLKEI